MIAAFAIAALASGHPAPDARRVVPFAEETVVVSAPFHFRSSAAACGCPACSGAASAAPAPAAR